MIMTSGGRVAEHLGVEVVGVGLPMVGGGGCIPVCNPDGVVGWGDPR
jgi:hypothetical protein